jgi:hypothetical protein
MDGENLKRTQSSIPKIGANHRATDERNRLLAGLEVFVNAGDSDQEYCKLQLQIPTFWPLSLRGPFGRGGLDERLEWPPAGKLLLCAFRDYLRRVWRCDFHRDDGSTVDGRYLEYLLGLEIRYTVDPPLLDAVMPNQAFRDSWLVLHKQHDGAYCSSFASVLPDWKSGKFEYVSANDFQSAVHLLLSESWRAKVCRRCGKYFVADKGAQVFCSTACSNQNRLEVGRRYWHEKGTVLREGRTNKRKIGSSKMGDHPPKEGVPG